MCETCGRKVVELRISLVVSGIWALVCWLDIDGRGLKWGIFISVRPYLDLQT